MLSEDESKARQDLKLCRQRIEELEREKRDIEGIIAGLKDIRLGKLKPLNDIIKLRRCRELAEMQKAHHGFQCQPYKVTFEECCDRMCVKAREILEEK